MIRHARTRLFTALFIVSSYLISPSATMAQAPPPVPQSHRWGVNDVHKATGLLPVDGRLQSEDLLVRARASGFGWVRYQVFWHVANPRPGEFDWWLTDVELARLEAAGYNVLLHVAYAPTWTTGASYPNEQAGAYCIVDEPDSTGSDRKDEQCQNPEYRPGYRPEYRANGYPPGYDRSQDFRAFVRALTARYGHLAKAWSFGMEAHNKAYWPGTHQQLLDEVLRPGYEEVKKVNPGAVVVGPDEDVEWSFAYFLKLEADGVAAGKSRAFDALAFHAFSHSGWGHPSQLEAEWRRQDCPFETSPAQTDCHVRRIAETYGQGRPLWLTEVGYRAVNHFDPFTANQASQWFTTWIQGIKQRPWIDKTFVFTLRRDHEAPLGDWALFMDDAGNTAVPALSAIASELANQPVPHFSYLAEGAINGFFDLDVLVANPHVEPAPVRISFLDQNGTLGTVHDTLPPGSRRKYDVGRSHLPALASAADVSTIVESTLGRPLVVERSMFWSRAGYDGGHGGTAVPQPERRWYFAEGSQGFFDTYVLLANSGTRTANTTVTFLLDEPGATPVVVTREIGAGKRETVWAGDAETKARLTNQSFAIVVDSDVPMLAERAMYFGGWIGGHESAGVPALAPTWLLAEGATGPFFDNWVLVGNPSTTAVETKFTFLLRSGQVVVGTPKRDPGAAGLGVIPPQSRFTLLVDDAASKLDILEGDAAWLADTAVSTKVEASEPVVVERAMYWPAVWTEAHNSFGVTETGVAWGLAEGRNGGPLGFETYILIANPSAEAAHIRVTFLGRDGTISVLDTAPDGTPWTVNANQRANVEPPYMPSGEFGAVIESINGVPIVVERAMYWTPAGGPPWGGGTNATGVKLR